MLSTLRSRHDREGPGSQQPCSGDKGATTYNDKESGVLIYRKPWSFS